MQTETHDPTALGYSPEASPEDADLVVAMHQVASAAPPIAGGDDDEGGDGGAVADPGGDSDPDANEGFEVPEPPSDDGGGDD